MISCLQFLMQTDTRTLCMHPLTHPHAFMHIKRQRPKRLTPTTCRKQAKPLNPKLNPKTKTPNPYHLQEERLNQTIANLTLKLQEHRGYGVRF